MPSCTMRTDSQYVYRAVQKNDMIRSNNALWNEYRMLSAERRVDVIWVQGHAGDQHNERADELARQSAGQGFVKLTGFTPKYR